MLLFSLFRHRGSRLLHFKETTVETGLQDVHVISLSFKSFLFLVCQLPLDHYAAVNHQVRSHSLLVWGCNVSLGYNKIGFEVLVVYLNGN